MYESLKRYSTKFNLYIFAFDEKSYNLLKKLNLKSVTIVSLREFEDLELLKVKSGRSTAEYCWTCTPSTIKYCIEKFNLDACTYLDADVFFFSNPEILIEEMENKSILLTEHRYTPEYDQTNTCGRFCVQFLTFKNDQHGMLALNWWRDSCNEWCFSRFEDGKFGDQKYLDDWPSRFQGVHVLQNLGGGVAPWNVQKFDLVSNQTGPLIFYHFHGYNELENDKIDLGSYRLGTDDIRIVYAPYVKKLEKITRELRKIDPYSDYNGVAKYKGLNWKNILISILRRIKGSHNILKKNDLL